jgi:hypothetical protein
MTLSPPGTTEMREPGPLSHTDLAVTVSRGTTEPVSPQVARLRMAMTLPSAGAGLDGWETDGGMCD